jgi:hypothetical protein
MGELPLKIAERECDTCIFSQHSPVGPERLKELIELWGSHGHQICHKFGSDSGYDDEDDDNQGLDGEDVWCRGFYNRIAKLQGERAAETMEAFRKGGLVVEVPFPNEEEAE